MHAGHRTGIEDLEADILDLSRVQPETLARLFSALAIDSVRALETPLRALAQEHLAVYESIHGPLYGRTRRNVTHADRRRDLARGVMRVDQEATARAADRYLRGIQSALDESDA